MELVVGESDGAKDSVGTELRLGSEVLGVPDGRLLCDG